MASSPKPLEPMAVETKAPENSNGMDKEIKSSHDNNSAAVMKGEESDGSDRISVTDLINLDNISAHNLYLGPEMRRLGSALVDSDAYSTSLLTENDDDNSEILTSKDTSRIGSSGSASPSNSKIDGGVDYSALDRFGFIVLGEDDSASSGRGTEEDKRIRKKQAKRNLREAHRATKWVDMLKILEGSGKSVTSWPEVHRKFEPRLAKGLPDCLRSKVWGLFTEGTSSAAPLQGKSFRELYMKVSGFERQIDLDIERTLRDHVLFKIRFSSAQVSLFKILVAYSNLDPAVGYCQGMSTVAAFMLLYFEEEMAFKVFVQVMQRSRLRHLYMVGFGLLFETFFIHEKLMQKFLPIIYAKLNSFNITTSIYATKWYLTLFLGFSFQLATRMWDLFLYYGFDILIVASIALLKMHEDRILRLDYEHCMEFLSRLTDSQVDENKLVDLTMRIWDRLVPSMTTFWQEQEELTRVDLDHTQQPTLVPTSKSSVFFRLRKAYALMKEKEASEKFSKLDAGAKRTRTVMEIVEFPFEAIPGRHLIVAYCEPKTEISLIRDDIMASGLIAINAELILDVFMLQVAANRVLISQRNENMKTKGLAAELLYSLSPSLHVTDSLKTFGISPGMKAVLFVAFDMPRTEFKAKITSLVESAVSISLNDLPTNADRSRIFKLFKVIDESDALNEIVNTIVTKGV